MKKEHITNCASYFNYGEIDPSIICEHYVWEEDEFINLKDVLYAVKNSVCFGEIYLFTSKIIFFPIPFKERYYGLWKNISKNYQINLIEHNEEKSEFNRFILNYGLAKFPSDKLLEALLLLKKEFMHSYLIIVPNQMASFNHSSYLNIDKNGSRYTLNFAKLITDCCIYNKALIITAIQGNNGFSVNIFKTKQSGDGSVIDG